MSSFTAPPPEVEIWVNQNQNESLPFRYADGTIDNDASSLVGGTLTARISKTSRDSVQVTKTPTITDAANGLYSVSILPSDYTSQGLTSGRWWMEVQLTDSAGNQSIISKVHLKVKPSNSAN